MFPIITLQSLLMINENIFNAFNTIENIESDVLIDTIMMNYGDRAAIYPNADIMEHAVQIWVKRWAKNIERLWRVYVVEYNPIWNKDGTTTETRTPNITKHSESIGSASSETEGSTEVVDDRQGFNSSEYVPVTRNQSDDEGSTESSTYGTTTETETGTETFTRTEGGNIGVTKTQEMIKDEWNLWAINNFYNSVAAMFAREFVIALF